MEELNESKYEFWVWGSDPPNGGLPQILPMHCRGGRTLPRGDESASLAANVMKIIDVE